jgi:hypothetical protein
MVEHQLPKLTVRVRFPSSAPNTKGQVGSRFRGLAFRCIAACVGRRAIRWPGRAPRPRRRPRRPALQPWGSSAGPFAAAGCSAGCSVAPRPGSALPCPGPTPPARSQQRPPTLPGPAAGARRPSARPRPQPAQQLGRQGTPTRVPPRAWPRPERLHGPATATAPCCHHEPSPHCRPGGAYVPSSRAAATRTLPPGGPRATPMLRSGRIRASTPPLICSTGISWQGCCLRRTTELDRELSRAGHAEVLALGITQLPRSN